jgi:chemotaxis protein CheX
MSDLTTWDLVKSEGYNTLKVNGVFDDELARRFEKEGLPKLLEEAPANWIVNCAGLSEMGNHFAKCLIKLQREAKAHNKQLRMILTNDKVKSFLFKNGLNTALVISPSLREAMVDFGLATKKAIDVNFINPFLTGTITALKIQAGINATPGKIFKQEDKSAPFSGDISGVIGLVSEAFNGSVVISFPEKTFLNIISKMLGETYTEITKDISDGAGELTNIIFGQAKVILNEKGYALKTAIPSVITGKNHKVMSLSSGPRVIVPFTSDAGDFCVEICVSE